MARYLFSGRWSRQFISARHLGRIAVVVVPLCALAGEMPRAFAGSPALDVTQDAHAAWKVSPSVRIEKIIADGKTYNVGPTSNSTVRLPPQVRNLEIAYTVPGVAEPANVRFRYQLEGYDSDWHEVGNRGQALYTRLTPGSYRFRIAANDGGVWNEARTFAEIYFAPAYWQTAWFCALGVAMFLVLMWALYQMRAARFNVTIEARVSERIRIARELHDTLLQRFQGFLLRIQAAQSLLPTRRAEAERMLEGAIAEALQAIREARSAGQELRSAAAETDDLGAAIGTLAQELASGDRAHGSTTSLAINVGGTPRSLQPLVRDEIYRISGEALRNAFRGEARRIELDLRYGVRWFELRVRHDGKGIDSRLLQEEALPGHYGLSEIRERSKIAGARLDIWSARKLGTELDLGVPAATAYRTTAAARPSWLLGKFSRRRA